MSDSPKHDPFSPPQPQPVADAPAAGLLEVMSDSHNHDPFSPPEPQRFDAHDFDPTPAAAPPSPPEVPMDPLLPSDPASAIAAPSERLALDGTSLWLNRL